MNIPIQITTVRGSTRTLNYSLIESMYSAESEGQNFTRVTMASGATHKAVEAVDEIFMKGVNAQKTLMAKGYY